MIISNLIAFLNPTLRYNGGRFPEVTEELVGNLTKYVQQSETLHQEHFSILISKRVDVDFTGEISDRTRPNVKVQHIIVPILITNVSEFHIYIQSN